MVLDGFRNEKMGKVGLGIEWFVTELQMTDPSTLKIHSRCCGALKIVNFLWQMGEDVPYNTPFE